MTKKAVSVTLRPDNLLWLKTHVEATGIRSLSEALDEIITEARAGGAAPAAAIRSVVGKARIPRSEEALSEAGAQVAALFRMSVGRKQRVRPGVSRKKSRRRAKRHQSA